MKMNAVALTALTATAAGCGSSASTQQAPPTQRAAPTAQITATPAVNVLALGTGSDAQRITATIQAFYRSTWQGHGAAACSLFSPNGSSGFISAAKIAFPQSVNTTTSCAQAMSLFNATLGNSVTTLQQAGVHVSGNVLNSVGVSQIRVGGAQATAQAPQGVEGLIKPKLIVLVRQGNRWLIDSSHKIGQTLPQMLAAARTHGQLRPKR
jgi:hypothetical protein